MTAALSRSAARGVLLSLLVAAPLALGSVHQWAVWPFWGLCFAAGLLSWAGNRGRTHGSDAPPVPCGRLLLAFHALVAFQLIPLPAPVLGLLSPASLALHRSVPGFESRYWLTVSALPRATLLGLAFLAAVSLVYAAAFREFRERHWARRLAGTVVGVAVAMTLVAFLQKGSADPGRIYGLWKPPFSNAVFGPYPNRSFFAGYVVMAIPLALTFAAEGLRQVREALQRRGARGITALGEPAGNRALLNLALGVFLVAGILGSGSRTGVVVLGLTALLLPLSFGSRLLLPAALVGLVAALGYAWVELGWFVDSFQSRSLEASRLSVWRDMWPIVKDYPLLGVGFNALGRVYRGYQTIYKWDWWAEAHNEYYQVLLDTGILGAGIAAAALLRLFRGALRGARADPLGKGLLCALLAQAAANLVDFNWQIPANAATFAALAGVALGREHQHASERAGRGDPPPILLA